MSSKKRRKAQAPHPQTRKEIARRRKEARQQRIALIALGAVGLIILILLALGLYTEFVRKPSAPVAMVGDVPIRAADFIKRVRLERATLQDQIRQLQTQKSYFDPNTEDGKFYLQLIDTQLRQLQSRLDNVGRFVLQQMIDEELIRQKAAEEGITVTPEEVQLQIEQAFGYQRNPPTPTPAPLTTTITFTQVFTGTPTPTPTRMTKEDFDKAYAQLLKQLQEQAGFTEQDYRKIIETIILREKLREVLAERVPTTAEQVHILDIVVDSREKAEEVLQKLEEGADFAELAKEYSTDELTAESGGDMGWVPRGELDPMLENVAFSLQVGEHSKVIETSDGKFHIIKVLGHEMDRELDSYYLAKRKGEALDKWLQGARKSEKVKILKDPEQVVREFLGEEAKSSR